MVDDACDEDAILLGLQNHVLCDIIGQLAEFDHPKSFLVELDGDSIPLNQLDKSHYSKVTLLIGTPLSLVTVSEPSIFVSEGDAFANFEVSIDIFTDARDGLFEYCLRVNDVAEEELAANQRRNLHLDGTGNFRRNIS